MRRPFQFSLRSMFCAVAVVAVLCLVGPPLVEWFLRDPVAGVVILPSIGAFLGAIIGLYNGSTQLGLNLGVWIGIVIGVILFLVAAL